MKIRKGSGTAFLLITIATATKTATAAEASLSLLQHKEREKCRSQITLTLGERLGVRENSELNSCLDQTNIQRKAVWRVDSAYHNKKILDSDFRKSFEFTNPGDKVIGKTGNSESQLIKFSLSSTSPESSNSILTPPLKGYTQLQDK